MTAASAASAAQAPLTREDYLPNPAAQQGRGEEKLVCPNPQCLSGDHLQLLERVTVATDARFYDVGVTHPEVETDPDTETVSPVRETREVIGIACTACHFSVTGTANPYTYLVRPS